MKPQLHSVPDLEITATTQEEKINSSLSIFKSTIESTTDGILVVNRQGKIIIYNQRFRKMWKIPRKVLDAGDDKKAIEFVLRALKDPQKFMGVITQFYAMPHMTGNDEFEFIDGRCIEFYSLPQRIGKKVVGRVFSFRDMTVRKQMEQRLVYMATHDELTGLPNRTLLMEKINQCIEHSQSIQRKAAVAFIDIDRFKGVNDSLGHNIGDTLLKNVAHRLSSCIRDKDILSRWGGDEFVLLLPDLKSYDEVSVIVKRCLDSLRAPFEVDEHCIMATASIGVSFYPKDGHLAQNLLKNADSAMYHAKSEGRNNYQVYKQHMTKQAVEKLELEYDIHNAIQSEQFELYYQPIVDLNSGAIRGAEALIRWNHPIKGFMSPDKFIIIAEETGSIVPIGAWVLKQACQQFKTWQDKKLPQLFMSVNVSALQLKDDTFFNCLEKVLKETGMDPHHLELEITETSFMNNLKMLLPLITHIKQKGITLSVDDFGTGYSSLNYIHTLPVDRLKIDKSFVQDDSHHKSSITTSIITLAKSLNLKIIAEGIETEKQRDFLKAHKCDMGQGYLFYRPMTAQSFEAALSSAENVAKY